MLSEEQEKRKPVLDTVNRVSEVVFGVMMALSFTGSLSVATGGDAAVHTMLLAALGCNIAWGVTDAVMYLIRTLTERRRRTTWLQQVQNAQNIECAHRLIAQVLPDPWVASHEPEALEALRKRLMKMPLPPYQLTAHDYAGAFWVFLLVTLATLPVAAPFMVIDAVDVALRLSHVLSLATLFFCGCALGRYAGVTAWRFGASMALIGVLLVVVIVTLGG